MFHNCKSAEDCKKLYRRLSLHLHPDKGGEPDLFALLQETYDSFISLHQELKESTSHKSWGAFDESAATNRGKYEYSYENIRAGDSRLEIIDEILAYAKTHKRFDPSFTNSMEGFIEENGYITSSQYNSLVRIYYAFHMDKPKK